MISGLNITLLVSGSIAAYKSAEITRELSRRGAKVHVVMSKAATEFITPLTLQTLSGNLVTTDLFDEVREAQINHIRLADNADLILVAPATADLIAKAAMGLADDALSTVLLATRSPIVYAPAMNVNMWENAITQENVNKLKSFGSSFINPAHGELACGWFGQGRLAEMDSIIHGIEYAVTNKDLKGSHIVVSAGPTREMIDPIRFISNKATGRMGFALARIAQLRGAKVSLVSGPTSLSVPLGVDYYPVINACQMRDKIFDLVSKETKSEDNSYPIQYVFMTAAVSDHGPAGVSSTKMKQDKKSSYKLEMVPSPDILQELGDNRAKIEEKSKRVLKLIGFSAENGDDEEIIAWAKDKLYKKNVDMILGNNIEDGFEKTTNRVWVLDRQGRQEEFANADKEVIARKIIDAALRV